MRPAPWLLGLALAALPAAARAQPCDTCRIAYPADAGALDVRAFGAKGDGHTDDTKAILAAIAASGQFTGPFFWQDRVVWLPNGTYLVSAPLLKRYQNGQFASGLMLQGESESGTVLRLADGAPGYDNPAQPRAVVFTAARLIDQGGPYGGGKDYPGKGEGNDAYENFVENLTIDVGRRNPGAIGIDYLANNIGAVRNVLLRAGPGSGAVGISMQRKWPGPALISGVRIEGFGVGLSAANTEYGMTLDHVVLQGQRDVAIRNDGNVLSIRDLHVAGAARPLVNMGTTGMIVLQGGGFTAEAGAPDDAVQNRGVIVLRDVALYGYGTIGGQPPVAGPLTLGPAGRVARSAPPWSVTPEDPPALENDPPSAWVRPDPVADHGDATQALRRALGSGATTIYLPHGTWFITDALVVPPTVRRIVGMNSTLKILPQRQPQFSRQDGMLRILDGRAPLSIERLAFDNTNLGDQLAVELAAPRSLLLRDIVSAGTTLLDRHADGGSVFLEDVCCGAVHISGPATAQAVQMDSEGTGPRLRIDGSPISILGLKTEGVVTAVAASGPARVDVVGGLLYMVQDNATPPPAFRVLGGARLAASYAEEALRPGAHYVLHLQSPTSSIAAQDLPPRGYGRFAPNLRTPDLGP